MRMLKLVLTAISATVIAGCTSTTGEAPQTEPPTSVTAEEPTPTPEEPTTTEPPAPPPPPTKPWQDLEPGDCLSRADVFTPETVTDVLILDCNEPHDLQVIASLTLEGEFPGDEEIPAVADGMCRPAAQEFVDRQAVAPWRYYYLHPRQQSFDLGIRTVVCIIGQEGVTLTEQY